MKNACILLITAAAVLLFTACGLFSTGEGPDWADIKSKATFTVADDSYDSPYIQPLNNGGWEDGLYISRDGLSLFAIYLPMDVFSLYEAWNIFSFCLDYTPYARGPELGVDLVTNPWNCPTFFQGDIIISERGFPTSDFEAWRESGLQRSVSNEGAPCGVLNSSGTGFEYFVFTMNRADTEDLEIMMMKNVPREPQMPTSPYAATSGVVPVMSSTAAEDNPHIEKLDDGTLLLFFDRDRYMYYSSSTDGGLNWTTAVRFNSVLNDQAPYDVQPHLWNDGTDWWVYFCADNESGMRSIYRSKQQAAGNWDSWGPRELVIAPNEITGYSGMLFGVGEPTLTENGDLSFVAVYGDPNSGDKTDRYDCDPWFLPKK